MQALPSNAINGDQPAASTTLRLFLIALGVRWAYAAALYTGMGTAGFISGDSHGYLSQGQRLVEYVAGALSGWAWLGVDLSTMPLYPWIVALNLMIAHSLAPLTIVLFQGVIDAATCVLVYGIASRISPRWRTAAGLAACFNPTQIVLSALVYTDTLFTFFVTLSLFGSVRWIRSPDGRNAGLIGLGLCGAALTRVLIVMWTPLLLIFLVLVATVGRRLRTRHLVHFVAIGAAVLLCLAPVLARNVSKFGAWSFTAQGGSHLALWVVPLVQEVRDGTPWETTAKLMEKQFRARFPNDEDNPFVESRDYAEFGRERLAELGAASVIKAWLVGAAINLGTPALIIAPPVAQLPGTGFYETKATSILGKIGNFLFHADNVLYGWLLLSGVVGVLIIRIIQALGVIVLSTASGATASLVLICLWFSFILVINGPVASPKYRLPIEPMLMVLTGAGLGGWRDWRRGRRVYPA